MALVVDGCAGPGGFDLGARMLGLDPLGFEWDPSACATRAAAGLRTVRADVTQVDAARMAGRLDGLLFSPPCQAFSMAGKGGGKRDLPLIWQTLGDLARGIDSLAELTARAVDPRSMVVAQPLRWALEALPEWMVWEQVPPVLAVWEACALVLRGAGYSVWTGILNAADYGVPQTRQRAFLLARLDGAVLPPAPTHTRDPWGLDLFGGELASWVSWGQALGTVGLAPPGCADDWVLRTEQLSETVAGRVPIERCGDEPAPTLVANADRWELRVGDQANATVRGHRDPAPTLFFGHQKNEVRFSRGPDLDPVRISIDQAAVLQSFPPDWPFQGTKTARFRQVGDAVPPLLAAHAIAAASGCRGLSEALPEFAEATHE